MLNTLTDRSCRGSASHRNKGEKIPSNRNSPPGAFSGGLYSIEQVSAKGKKMALECTTLKRPVLKAYDVLQDRFLLYQPRCKMWKCQPCANTNRLLWQAKIGHGYEWYNAHEIDGWNMLTITASPKNKTFDQCLFRWKNQWSKLSSRMRRKHPGFRYVILPECHKDGRVHWHLIASGNIKTRWLKDNSAQCGLGFMATAEAINDGKQAIGYVSKYISKSIYELEWPSKMKRISTSQKWPKLPPEETFVELDVDWKYYLTYIAEGLSYLAWELEDKTGIRTEVLT